MQGSSRPDQEFLDAKTLCGHLLPEGSVTAFLAEHRREVFPDELFADLFPSDRGRPSVPAEVIATVMLLQSLEGLSDREAVRRLETDITWKAAAGLALTAELRASDRPQRIFEAVRTLVDATGVLAKRNRRALDSTVLKDAVQRQDTVTMLVAQIRKVRKLIPDVAEHVFVHEEDLVGSRPPCDWDDRADIDRLVSQLVEDANELVFAVEDAVEAGFVLSEEQADALALLALVAGQDVEPGERPGQWRIAKRTAPDRVLSTVDPQSRHTHKTAHAYRDGYKGHLAIEPETGIVTATGLTPGNIGDAEAAEDLLADEPAGTEVVADSAYGSGELRAKLAKKKMTAVVKPSPLRPAVEGGFTLDDFAVDLAAGTVTCPEGITVRITRHRRAAFGHNCDDCPMRHRCTNANGGRVIVFHPHHALLVAARVFATTDAFDDVYRNQRPMVERTIAWLVRGGNRKVRYRGVGRNRLWLAHRAAAINLRRLVNLGLSSDGGSWAVAGA
jgi:IS5 family transposase